MTQANALLPQVLAFGSSAPLTVGVELELGIVEPVTMDLTPGAPQLLEALWADGLGSHVKPELTNAMIELNSSVHRGVETLHAELEQLTTSLVTCAGRLGLLVVGGGTHPFQNWVDRSIHDSQRFREISRTYGYMAQQFTVFGQHVHVGCESGDDAMYLTHALTRYSPLLIALSAASPYWRGIDTGFDCCRLNVVSAFPMSGTCPAARSWRQFERFFGEMQRRGVVASMKDFYWDVRPKPEFGTVEVRVCDTPLRVADAVDIAALVQALAADLLAREREWPDEYFEWIYARNRFQACRFGFDGQYLDVDDPASAIRTIGAALEDLLERLAPRFAALESRDCLERLLVRTRSSANGASWLRGQYRTHANFPALVRGMGAELLAPAPVAA